MTETPLKSPQGDPVGGQRKGLWLAGALCLMPGGLYLLSDAPMLPSLVLFLNLWVLSLYDLASFRLPNLLTATLFLSGLMQAWLQPADPFMDHLIGAGVGLAFLPVVNFVYKRLRGRDGVGLGDAKLLAGLGMWLGWQALPPTLLVASLAGLIFGLCSLLGTGRDLVATKIPFGPFLCVGGWVAWLFF